MIWEKAMWEWEKKWNSLGIRTSVISNVLKFTVNQFFSFEKLFAFSLPKNLRKKCRLFHKKRLNVLKFTRNLLTNFLHVMNLKLTNFVTSLRGFLKKKKKLFLMFNLHTSHVTYALKVQVNTVFLMSFDISVKDSTRRSFDSRIFDRRNLSPYFNTSDSIFVFVFIYLYFVFNIYLPSVTTYKGGSFQRRLI